MKKTQYVDSELLDEYINSSGVKIGFLIDQLGLSRQGFDKKRKGIIPFKAAEVFVLCALLHITDEDKTKIFAF